MNKEELEKLFDNTDKYDFHEYEENGLDASYSTVNMNKIKQFIFETIIPEVLRGLINDLDGNKSDWFGPNDIEFLKHKAKELYGIDL